MKDLTVRDLLFAEEPGDYRRTWTWAIPFLVIIFFIGGQLLFLLPMKPLNIFTENNLETYPYIIYMLIGVFGTVGLIAFAWIKYFERRHVTSVGLGVDGRTKPVFARGVAQGIGMGCLVVLGGLAFGGYGVEGSTSLSFSTLLPIGILLFCFLVQSSVEEIVFRGWMLNRIAAKHGFWVGAIGNSLVFALLHIDDSVVSMTMVEASIFVSMTMFFSIFLSLMVRRDRSVWGACAWHASWNWLFITWWGLPTTGIELGLEPLLVDLMPVEGAPKWLSGGAMGPEDTIFAVMVLMLGSIYYVVMQGRSESE